MLYCLSCSPNTSLINNLDSTFYYCTTLCIHNSPNSKSHYHLAPYHATPSVKLDQMPLLLIETIVIGQEAKVILLANSYFIVCLING